MAFSQPVAAKVLLLRLEFSAGHSFSNRAVFYLMEAQVVAQNRYRINQKYSLVNTQENREKTQSNTRSWSHILKTEEAKIKDTGWGRGSSLQRKVNTWSAMLFAQMSRERVINLKSGGASFECWSSILHLRASFIDQIVPKFPVKNGIWGAA